MATLTSILASDLISASRATINTNFQNLNTGTVDPADLTDRPFLIVGSSNADYLTTGTNDNIAIQAALDALPANGGEVYLKPGTYNIGTSIVMDSYQTLGGAGAGTILKAKTNLNSDIITTSTASSSTHRHMVVKNMQIDGNRGNNTSGRGIYMFNSRNSIYQNIWIHDTDEEAIYLHGDASLGWFNQIDNCEIELCDAGVRFGFCEHNWFTRNTLAFITGKGLFCESDLDYIINNQFDFIDDYEVHLYFGAGIWTVTGNSFDRPQSDALKIEGADKTTVDGNYFDSAAAGKAAIINAGSDNVQIINNRAPQTGGAGSYGLRELGASNNCTYVHNDFSGATTAVDINTGSTGFVAHNNVGSIVDTEVQVFNVKGFGAKGDGTTDDSAAIQRAIIAAEAVASGTVYIPYGTYILNATLNVTHSRRWRGDGWGSILKIKNATNIFAITFTPNVSDYIDGATFENFKIDCNGANQTSAGGGIYGKGAVWCKFDHLWVTKPWNNGMYLLDDNLGSYGHHNTVINCLFDEGDDTNGGDGRAILLDQSDENYIAFNTFQNNGRAAATEPNHIYEKAGLNEFVGNSFVNGQTGLKLQGEHNRAIGNVFDGCLNHCIRLNGNKNVLTANHFYKVGVTGTSNTLDAVFIDNVVENLVQANIFEAYNGTNAARYGINFANGAVRNSAINNIFTIAGSGTWGSGFVSSSAANLVVSASGDKMGIGNTAPAALLNVGNPISSVLSSVLTNGRGIGVGLTNNLGFVMENTGASGSGAGIGAAFYSNDAAAMASGDRLGFFLFGGTSSVASLRNSAFIGAYAAENWVDAGAYGTNISFENTKKLNTARAEELQLSANGNVVLGYQASIAANATDGFVYIPIATASVTGTPTAYTGKAAMVYDTTDRLLYINAGGGWASIRS